MWLPVAAKARQHSAVAFLDITKAAPAGALNSVTSGYRTMRYQELLVIALTACHMTDTSAPPGLLDHLAAFTLAAFTLAAFPSRAVAPRPSSYSGHSNENSPSDPSRIPRKEPVKSSRASTAHLPDLSSISPLPGKGRSRRRTG
jgi:hypothetical protein